MNPENTATKAAARIRELSLKRKLKSLNSKPALAPAELEEFMRLTKVLKSTSKKDTD
jgi:hypothetical protein